MVRLFVDTDIGPDCDDAGALQVVHSLCARGRAALIGVSHCTSSPYGAPTVSAIGRYNGREVPIGTFPRPGFLAGPECLRYSRPVSEAFDHEYRDGRPQRPAREVFEEVLAASPDGSVTVMGIGPMNNLAEYISDARGRGLVRRKVCRLVAMAGRFDCDTPEWNVQMDVPAARAVRQGWPTEVVLCGFECGFGLMTGAGLEGLYDSPVRAAYKHWTGGGMRRDSWDLVTALYAVLGESGYIGTSPRGRVTVTDDARTVFTPEPGGPHRYTIVRAPREKLAGRLDALLSEKPKRPAAR